MILILMTSILFARSIEINQNSTHYDYERGIGRIIENYHYVHFYINTTSLSTYNKILPDYTLLSWRKELKNASLLVQASLLCNEIYQDLQEIAQHQRTKRGLINGLGKAIKFIFGNPDADDLDEIKNYLNALKQQQNEDILVLNKSISVMNKINKDINNN